MYIYMYVHTCIHLYMFMCTYTYACTYIHTHIQDSPSLKGRDGAHPSPEQKGSHQEKGEPALPSREGGIHPSLSNKSDKSENRTSP